MESEIRVLISSSTGSSRSWSILFSLFYPRREKSDISSLQLCSYLLQWYK